MILSPKTKVLQLVEQHLFLIDFLADYNPKFAGFRNPVLRKTFGRAASLGKIASMGNLPVDKLIYDISNKVKEITGLELEVDLAQLPLSREERREVLEVLVRDLHEGKDVEDVKRRFKEVVEDVSPTEISEMEQSLIQAGMPIENITHLCDAHASIFKESLNEYELPTMPAGHPVHTYRAENEALVAVCDEMSDLLSKLGDSPVFDKLMKLNEQIQEAFDRLSQVEIHYARKENQLFPFLEREGVTGPPKVMWGVHDEIRDYLRGARRSLKEHSIAEFTEFVNKAMHGIREMVFKEHYILLPMALELLKEHDWLVMRQGEDAIGYAFIKPGKDWPSYDLVLEAAKNAREQSKSAPVSSYNAQNTQSVTDEASSPRVHALPDDASGGFASVMLNLQTGALTPEQVNMLFNHLPVEISFTDENHIVRYYSEGRERIFPRSPGVIGRDVENCHPPKSLHMVRAILDAFEKGERDVSEFWIEFQDRFVYIRYFAVRDAMGRFRGTMEVVQDVTHIRELTGERRLLDWT